jgi:RNA polymerase sigma-70 factor, ECF subfamily
MTFHAKSEYARRFRDAALPYIGDTYTLAYFLMRNQVDAGDAVQECYLRALRGFDGFRGPAIKPWLLAILRSTCYAKLARRRQHETPTGIADCEQVAEAPLRRQPGAPPDSAVTVRQDGAVIRQFILALPMPLRETIVLCELNGLTYREIAEVVGVPVETVMSRLARARAMLLWKATDLNVSSAREALAVQIVQPF